MNESHASALATIRELHAMGATSVEVGPEHVAAKFDRVFVPLQQATRGDEPSLSVSIDGDSVAMSANDVQLMRDELESLRDMKRHLESQGVL